MRKALSVLVLLTVMEVSLIPFPTFTNVAFAQQCPSMEGRRVTSVRQANIKKFEKLAEFFEAENVDAAEAELRRIATISDLNNVERAYVYNYQGSIAASRDQLDIALSNFARILDIEDGISLQFYNQIMYVVAQIYFSQENYRQALFYAQCWFETTELPSADAFIMVGQAQYALKDYNASLPNVQKGIDLYREQGAIPKENWFNLLASIYREKKDFRRMIPVLKELVEHYPKKSHLITLGGVYNRLGQQEKMTAVYLALYDLGLIERETEVITLASLLLADDNPYKASEVLKKGLDDGILNKNLKNYRMYSQALFQAREFEQSLGPMEKAAGLSPDGQLYVQLGQSLLSIYRYKEAEQAFIRALDRGKLRDVGSTLLNLGRSQFEQKKFDVAKETFRRAQKIKRSEENAGKWLRYVDSEVKLIEELKKPIVINLDVKV